MRLNAKSRLFAIRRNSMHELGIVFHIAKKVESLAVENHVNHVAKVVLQI